MQEQIFEFDLDHDTLQVEMLQGNGAWIKVAAIDLTQAVCHPDTYLCPGFFKLSLKEQSHHLNDEPPGTAVSTPHDAAPEQVLIVDDSK